MNSNKPTIRQDLQWINVLKMICSFFIYLRHSVIFCGEQMNVTSKVYDYFFITNTFFFLSGYLFFWKQLSNEKISLGISDWWKSKGGGKHVLDSVLCKLALPIILFSIIYYLPKITLRNDIFTLSDFTKDTFLGGSLWFTCALTTAELLLLILLLFRIKNIWTFVLFGTIMLIVGTYLRKSDITFLGDPNLPWQYKKGMIGCFYLVIGGLYQKYEYLIDNFFINTLLILT